MEGCVSLVAWNRDRCLSLVNSFLSVMRHFQAALKSKAALDRLCYLNIFHLLEDSLRKI